MLERLFHLDSTFLFSFCLHLSSSFPRPRRRRRVLRLMDHLLEGTRGHSLRVSHLTTVSQTRARTCTRQQADGRLNAAVRLANEGRWQLAPPPFS